MGNLSVAARVVAVEMSVDEKLRVPVRNEAPAWHREQAIFFHRALEWRRVPQKAPLGPRSLVVDIDPLDQRDERHCVGRLSDRIEEIECQVLVTECSQQAKGAGREASGTRNQKQRMRGDA